MVCSPRHDARRDPHARAPARPRPLRAQHREDGGLGQGGGQEAPAAFQDPQVPGDRAPPDRRGRRRDLLRQGGRGRGDGGRRHPQHPDHHRGRRAREDRPAARACSSARPRRWSSWTIPTTCASWGRPWRAPGKVLNVLVDVDVGGRRTGAQPGEPAVHVGAHGHARDRAQPARAPGLRGALRARDGLRQPAQDLAPVDEPPHEDARSLREERAARRDRQRRLVRHLQHRQRPQGPDRAAVRAPTA